MEKEALLWFNLWLHKIICSMVHKQLQLDYISTILNDITPYIPFIFLKGMFHWHQPGCSAINN